ncbi:hypothetical protein [Photobacterium kishitanii]|nr:hypothetical protein [Photobacterium kishitanii]
MRHSLENKRVIEAMDIGYWKMCMQACKPKEAPNGSFFIWFD